MNHIALKKIDESNFIDCFNLKLAPGQEKYVSNPIRSLAQAYVYPDITAEKVREILAGETRYLYVHLDLDALSPDAFPNTPLPVEGGLSTRAVLTLLEALAGSPAFVGLGVYEYVPCGNRSEFIGTIVDLVIPKR